ncbi:MAG TPA: HAD-IC family P-type ATPase [Polyangia bacterium]|nr:HAD-IC family P-type ATPase [Polyangia bacterium]
MKTLPSRDIDCVPVWASPAEEVLSRLGTRPTGLDGQEPSRRLATTGPNRLPDKPPRSAWMVLVAQLKGFLNLLLLVAALVAWAVGDLKDALMIGAVTVFNAILGFVQEHRAERALQALKHMVAFRTRVRRGGRVVELGAEQLVPGDIALLEAGDRVPADGRLFVAQSFEVDESALTGESVPVHKTAEAVLPPATPLAERINVVFMNSVVTRGRGELVVSATGRSTEMGRIAGMLEATPTAPTPLQAQLHHLAKRLALIAVIVVAAVSAVELLHGDTLAQMAIEAVALAVAAVPEGLPAVVTVTLALGLQRMARHRAIVKRLAAVETLGCTTVICSDKTGTLTMNQMTVRALWLAGRRYRVSGEGYRADGEIAAESPGGSPDQLAALLRPAVLCNDSRVADGVLIGDPTEGALVTLAQKARLDVDPLRAGFPRLAELPFDSERRYMATFHRDGDVVRLFVKGAPGTLLERSRAVLTTEGTRPLDDGPRNDVMSENDRLAAGGLRVLAVATRELREADFDPKQELTKLVADLTFVGLVGMMDPPRAEARDAIQLCKSAGIAVKMITGDQRVTAAAIARALGLEGDAVTGAELDRMDDATLAAALPRIAVFARVAPEHKLRIVSALQSRRHVVAMTGDGVNDAPALRKADIGVAMGAGTEVAKEAAGMVLTDDNFATIVRAVGEGRIIYDNIVKFVRFQLSTNMGAILTVFFAPFVGLESPLGAVQILWVAMISDGPPAIALGVDAARPGIMNEPPRDPAARILTWRRLLRLLFHGAIMAAGTLGVQTFDGAAGGSPAHAATLAFTTFVLFQVFNVLNVRAEKGTALNRQLATNWRLWATLAMVVLLQVGVVYWSPLQRLFGAVTLGRTDWAVCIAVASTVFIAEELRKLTARGLRAIAGARGRVAIPRIAPRAR